MVVFCSVPVLSKLFENVFLVEIKLVLAVLGLIPIHQFGFRENHATTKQIRRNNEAFGKV